MPGSEPPDNLDEYPELRLEKFVGRFPEFRQAGQMIVYAIREAAREVNARVYGCKRGMAIAYLAAHKLALSPYGRGQRLVKDDNTTTYWGEFERIRREVTPKFMVT